MFKLNQKLISLIWCAPGALMSSVNQTFTTLNFECTDYHQYTNNQWIKCLKLNITNKQQTTSSYIRKKKKNASCLKLTIKDQLIESFFSMTQVVFATDRIYADTHCNSRTDKVFVECQLFLYPKVDSLVS